MKKFLILLVVLFLANNLFSQNPIAVKNGAEYKNDTGKSVYVFTRPMLDSIAVRALEYKDKSLEVKRLRTLIDDYRFYLDVYAQLDTVGKQRQALNEALVEDYKELLAIEREEHKYDWLDSRGFGIGLGVGGSITVFILTSWAYSNITN